MPPGFDRFESFGHDELIAKHCYLKAFLDVDGIRIFDKDDQAAKHLNVLQPGCVFPRTHITRDACFSGKMFPAHASISPHTYH